MSWSAKAINRICWAIRGTCIATTRMPSRNAGNRITSGTRAACAANQPVDRVVEQPYRSLARSVPLAV